MTPEELMKDAFMSLFKAQENLRSAVSGYLSRNDDNTADSYNAENVKKALLLMSKAYDEISAIWENDINV